MQPRILAFGVHEQVSSEHESFEGGLEDLHATMNGEADVEVAQQQMNLGEGEMSNEAGERAKVQLEETPATEGFKDNEPVLDNIFDYFKSFWDNLFGGDDGHSVIMDSFGNIRDSDCGRTKTLDRSRWCLSRATATPSASEGAIDVVKWYQEGKLHFTTHCER